VPFFVFSAEHAVGPALANGGTIRRHLEHAQLVNLTELTGRRDAGSGHARQVRIEMEVILHGNARCLPGLGGHFDISLGGFNSLVQSGPPFATFGSAAGKLIDDYHFAVAHDVLAVAEEFAFDLYRTL